MNNAQYAVVNESSKVDFSLTVSETRWVIC